MKHKFTALILLFISVIFIISGCSNPTNTKKAGNKDKLIVYTTVYPLQYFTERIGGKWVEANTVYPPGADEHTFEPTQKDMMKLADSDLFFYIGFGLEGFVESTKDTLKNEQVRLVAAGEKVHMDSDSSKEENHEEEDGHDHGDVNPHIWLDPVYSKDMVQVIEKELIKAMPKHEKEFAANSKKLLDELDKLDARYEDVIAKANNKEIIVSHAAFGYWENRYHLKQTSISGLSTSSEPSQKELKQIIAIAKDKNIKYIFFEQNVTSKLTKIVQNEIGAKPLTLHNLSVLTDEDIKKDRNYMTIMYDNLDALEKALQ
ncbi:metal ABC transporter solute-binding protein, Zn/Mn family [Bacillus massilinigeriensis]|uniref:metal ABC transporter solute-binding protein, Zn/Mn family n=1 Tax=Bacillus massilionigeriensis TaxID=1805475 RepID=UPI00096B3BE5|nr:zinc ABC transporter substrate-binding protein [Bacillus massilionigeriensis]